jgi:tRNA threonylcarbamoyladenosine biosynthesis protein TsaE
VTGYAVITGSPDETRGVARSVAPLLRAGDVLVVAGDLGSGKTTFVQGLAAGLGVTDPVVSPTFTLAREYDGRVRLVHVDVYRLDRAQEILELGLDDLADDAVLVVEWGDVATAYLASDYLEVGLAPGPDDQLERRTVTFDPRGRSWMARADTLGQAVGVA